MAEAESSRTRPGGTSACPPSPTRRYLADESPSLRSTFPCFLLSGLLRSKNGVDSWTAGWRPVLEEDYQPLATSLQPVTNATLTVRIIKSFEFRTQKALVLPGLDLSTETVGGLMGRCREAIKSAPGFKPYRSLVLDTLKLYTVAHGHKTTNLIINLDHDEWILGDLTKTLVDIGAENETELSFFNREAYEAFKSNPKVKWD